MRNINCTRWTLALVMPIWAIVASPGNAKPYTPGDDAVVLERLPEKNEPSLTDLKRLRATLLANPRDLDAAARVAKRSIEAARATGDPRFLGQAQAALNPWWTAADAPAPALLLRATIKQSQHDFAGALADLDRLLADRPSNGQALLTRATILTVQGRYKDAQRDCAKLVPIASVLVTATCFAGARSLNGDALSAYSGLTEALARPGEAAAVRAWALTLAAEIAARQGEPAVAESHFRAALSLDPSDSYLRGAYADFLLLAGRARDVLPLVANDTKNDSMLLRLTLAEQALPEHAAAFATHRNELANRFAAAKMRGDTLHLREEARFRLEIENETKAALALAQQNWKTQREPADLRVLAAAARAARDSSALKTVADWIAATRLEDPATVALIAGTAP